jgi:hypothetical protein
MVMIEVIANDRLGKKVRVKCDSEDTVGDLKVRPHTNLQGPLRRLTSGVEIDCCADGHGLEKDCAEEVVYFLQGPYQAF